VAGRAWKARSQAALRSAAASEPETSEVPWDSESAVKSYVGRVLKLG